MSTDLDGTYLISTTSSYQGPLDKKSDGETTITNGQTSRIDKTGCQWTSTFKTLSESQVEMTSVADPTNAPPDFALTRINGTPTREPQTYKTTLKLQRKDDRIQMSGQIQYGNEIVFLTMRKK